MDKLGGGGVGGVPQQRDHPRDGDQAGGEEDPPGAHLELAPEVDPAAEAGGQEKDCDQQKNGHPALTATGPRAPSGVPRDLEG